jgi:hypothetical protein
VSAAASRDPDLAAVAAALLEQGKGVDAASRLVTVIALFGLLLPAVTQRGTPLLAAALGLVLLIGVAETYLAIRVGFDAALFRRVADRADAFNLDRLDAALLRLRLIPPAKAGRPIDRRIVGARRLLHWQGLMLALQAALLVAGAAVSALHDWRAG